MKPDAIIEVCFITTAEGGRHGPVKGSFYGCPMFVDGEGFECRLLLEGQVLQLGESYEVEVKFMNPDLVRPKLSPGKSVSLWEGREVAKGKVLRLL